MLENLTLNNLNYYILRTPYLPYLNAGNWRKDLENPNVQKSIFFASPDLYDKLIKLQKGLITDTKEKFKIEQSLYKYWLRMSFRSTPFGLFAGTGICRWGTSEAILTTGGAETYIRLDMQVIGSIVHALESHPLIQSSLKYFPNDSISKGFNKTRYIESRYTNGIINYNLSAVENNEYLEILISGASKGLTIQELSELIVDPDITTQDAIDFIGELIESKLLRSELNMKVTGIEYEIWLLKFLEDKVSLYKINDTWIDQIISLLHELQDVYSSKNIEIAAAKSFGQRLTDLSVPFQLKTLLQIDLIYKEPLMSLTVPLMDHLKLIILKLSSIYSNRSDNQKLTRFKEVFSDRFEEEEIPFLQALDSESGISYPAGSLSQSDLSPLLKGINMPDEESRPDFSQSPWTAYLLRRYIQLIKEGQKCLELSDEDFEPFLKKEQVPALPFSLASFIQLVRSDNDGLLIYHSTTVGPSAAKLIGRFCHADKVLEQNILTTLAREQAHYPDQILAEIVHLPQSRAGNIIMRPQLRDYEIPIITNSSENAEQITLSDLFISVRNGRIILRSGSLNKEIIPRLTNAHNFSMQSLPYYHFLCDLQSQDLQSSVTWQWGQLQGCEYLPRVTYKNVILEKASWLLHSKAIGIKTVESLRNYLRSLMTPSHIIMSEGDNHLPIDITDDLSLEILLKELDKNSTIRITENIFKEFNTVVTDQLNQPYTNELIVPWEFPDAAKLKKLDDTVTRGAIQRRFTPGSEWLYFKIYCGVKAADELLTDVIFPLMQSMIRDKTIEKWFFIRYADPQSHLRIRLTGARVASANILNRLSVLIEEHIESRTAWKIQTDTYNRELERYGEKNIEQAEDFFFHDSVAVVKVLGQSLRDEGEDSRWKAAIIGVDYLLNDFCLSINDKIAVLQAFASNFSKEFKMDNTKGRKIFGDRFRVLKNEIQNVLTDKNQNQVFHMIFQERSRNIQKDILTLRNSLTQNETDQKFKLRIVNSYMHMFINRLFRSKQRPHELMINELMYRSYVSILAQQLKKEELINIQS